MPSLVARIASRTHDAATAMQECTRAEAIVTDLEAPLLTFQTYFLMGDLRLEAGIERPPTVPFSSRVGLELSEAACVGRS